MVQKNFTWWESSRKRNLKITTVKHPVLLKIASYFIFFPYCNWGYQTKSSRMKQICNMNRDLWTIHRLPTKGFSCVQENDKPTLDKGYSWQPSVHIFSIYIHLPDDRPHSWSWRRTVAPFAFSLLSSFLYSCCWFHHQNYCTIFSRKKDDKKRW